MATKQYQCEQKVYTNQGGLLPGFRTAQASSHLLEGRTWAWAGGSPAAHTPRSSSLPSSPRGLAGGFGDEGGWAERPALMTGADVLPALPLARAGVSNSVPAAMPQGCGVSGVRPPPRLRLLAQDRPGFASLCSSCSDVPGANSALAAGLEAGVAPPACWSITAVALPASMDCNGSSTGDDGAQRCSTGLPCSWSSPSVEATA